MKISAESQENALVSGKTARNSNRVVQSTVALGKVAADQAKPVSVSGKSSALPGNSAVNLENLLSALKLPQDNLSRSIIAFTRFFSLPLEAKFLNSLRREALSMPGNGAAGRESSVLGAVAALDKGLKLDRKALGEYAAAIEGSIKSFTGQNREKAPINSARPGNWHIKDREGGGQQSQDNSPGTEDNGLSQEGGHNDHGFQENERKQHDNPQRQPAGYSLQQKLTEILKDRPLLDMINRIPGKKGRWVVIPFSFFQNGFEFNVSLRMLLYDNETLSGKLNIVERFTAEIAVNKKTAEGVKHRYWFISLERPVLSEETVTFPPESRVKIFSETAVRSLKEKVRLRRELAKTLNIPFEQVEVLEKPLLFADSREDVLRLVNEEV